MKTEITTLRQDALKWWRNLSESQKLVYWAEYCTAVFSPSLRPSDLTGREIQNIWAVKTN